MTASPTSDSSGAIFVEGSTWASSEGLTWSATWKTLLPASPSAVLIRDITAMMWQVLSPLFLVLGTFGNVMVVVVMRGMRDSQSTACLSLYFTALAVCDQCQLVTYLPFKWVEKTSAWPPSFFRFNILCFLPKTVWNVTGLMSAWFLVAMTYQRVTAVVAPHRVGVVCSARRGKLIVAGVVLLGCAVHLQFLFSWVYQPEFNKCQYRKKYRYFMEVFEWLDLVLYSVLPSILLVGGNSVLLWKVDKSVKFSGKIRRSWDPQANSGSCKVNSMTTTVIVATAVFLVMSLPICIIGVCLPLIYSQYSDEYFNAVINLVRCVSSFMWMGLCSTNFYLYLLSGRKFREETKKILAAVLKWTGDKKGGTKAVTKMKA